jgi:hypothetical protein
MTMEENPITTCIKFALATDATRDKAAAELAELKAIKEAAWKLAEHPTSEAKLRELARLLGVEL